MTAGLAPEDAGRSHLDDPHTLVVPHLSFLAWAASQIGVYPRTSRRSWGKTFETLPRR
jgi:hypothetical protein